MNEYPRFERGEVSKKYNKLPKDEKKIIDDFVSYVGISSTARTRLENNRRAITQFRMVTKKPLKETTLQDLRSFLSLLNNSDKTQSTRNDIKHAVKRFLKWYFKDWSKRFNDLSDIKLIVGMNEEKINADTLLKKEDIETIMKTETRFVWKTFFICLYESGLRPIELRTLRWKNIKLGIDGDLSEINVYASKTSKARSVYVKEATKYLQEWKERQEREEVKNDLLFPAKKNPDKPIGKNVVSEWLRVISKKAIGREVNPYLLRHSRATELYTNANIPEKLARKFLGHGKSMSDVYTHLSNKDVKEAMSKTIYQTEDLPPEKKHALELELERQRKEIGELRKYISITSKQDKNVVEALEIYKKELFKMKAEIKKYKSSK